MQPTAPSTKLLIAVVLLTTLAGCSSGPQHTAAAKPPSSSGSHTTTPPTASASPRPTAPARFVAPGAIDQRDATAVSRAALTIMWSVDSIRDHKGQRDTYLRASTYLTPEYAARIRKTLTPQRPPGLWKQHRAFSAVELVPIEDEDDGPDTPTRAGRQWSLTITPTGRDGWTGETFTVLAFVDLTRPSLRHPWRIADVVVS